MALETRTDPSDDSALTVSRDERTMLRLRLGQDVAHTAVNLALLATPNVGASPDEASRCCIDILMATGTLEHLGATNTNDDDEDVAIPVGFLSFVGQFAHAYSTGNVSADERTCWRAIAVRADAAGARISDMFLDFSPDP